MDPMQQTDMVCTMHGTGYSRVRLYPCQHYHAPRILPFYRNITTVKVGDGKATSFWDDIWIEQAPLSERYPSLYSHVSMPTVNVHRVITEGILNFLVPRLNGSARKELSLLQAECTNLCLTSTPDRRTCPFETEDGLLPAGPIYKAIKLQPVAPAFCDFVWRNNAPPKVQFFGWLLVQHKIKCRRNLYRKNIVDIETCPICLECPETANHLILECSFSRQIWANLSIGTEGHDVASLWLLPRPAPIPSAHYNMLLLLVCWMLWKHRNEVVFNGLPPSRDRFRRALIDTAMLWRHRLKPEDAAVPETWCGLFNFNM